VVTVADRADVAAQPNAACRKAAVAMSLRNTRLLQERQRPAAGADESEFRENLAGMRSSTSSNETLLLPPSSRASPMTLVFVMHVKPALLGELAILHALMTMMGRHRRVARAQERDILLAPDETHVRARVDEGAGIGDRPVLTR
jgi:hypothetical protein